MEKKKFINQMVHDAVNPLSYLFFEMEEGDEKLKSIKHTIKILRAYEAVYEEDVSLELLFELANLSNTILIDIKNPSYGTLLLMLYHCILRAECTVKQTKNNEFEVKGLSSGSLTISHALLGFIKEKYTFKVNETKSGYIVTNISEK